MKFSEAWQGHVRVLTATEFIFLHLLILKFLFSKEKTDDLHFFHYLREGKRFMLMFTRLAF